MKKRSFFLILSLVLSIFCLGIFFPSPRAEALEIPPLSFWNDGNTKQEIIDFVQDVTNPESPNFVKPSDRVAVFDNDGTLWPEKPCFFEEALIVHQQESLEADDNGCLKDKITEDIALKNIEVNSGIETEEYKTNARNFLDTELHPRFGVPYIQLTYQPMVQLLDYLRGYDFQIYISSGGEIDFIRSFAEDAYKVTPPNVIGTSFLSKFEITEEGEPILIRLRIPVLPINNYDGKAIGIERYISKKPIIAVGNYDGDVAMLQYTDDGKGRNLMMLVHHDDSEREYEYDEGAENALAEAEQNGWTLISIKNDFRKVFSLGAKR